MGDYNNNLLKIGNVTIVTTGRGFWNFLIFFRWVFQVNCCQIRLKKKNAFKSTRDDKFLVRLGTSLNRDRFGTYYPKKWKTIKVLDTMYFCTDFHGRKIRRIWYLRYRLLTEKLGRNPESFSRSFPGLIT